MPSIGDQLSNTWTHGGIVCIQTTAAHNPGTIVTMLGIPCSIAKIPGWVFSRGKSEWRLYIDCKDIQGTFLQDLFVLEVLIDDFLKSHLERGHDSVGLQDGYLLTNNEGSYWKWKVSQWVLPAGMSYDAVQVVLCAKTARESAKQGWDPICTSMAGLCCLPGLSSRRNTRLWLLLLELLPIAFVKTKHLFRHMQHWKKVPQREGIL